MLYRLITENKNYESIKDILKAFPNGSTIYKATIIEIDGGGSYFDVIHLAKAIKKLNSQEAVTIQQIQTRTESI